MLFFVAIIYIFELGDQALSFWTVCMVRPVLQVNN